MAIVRRRILRIYLVVLLIGMGYVLWLRTTGLGISCYLRETTSLMWPGCGISRMFLAMLQLDFAAAFAWHPVAFCLFFLWNGIALLCFFGKPAFVHHCRFLYGSLWCSIGILVIYCILRNILIFV